MTSRTFIVTGGTKGIGFATVQRLINAGHHTISLARSKPSNEFPGDFVSVDLADTAATGDVIEQILDNNQIDGVVNNVGLVRPAAIGEVEFADLEDVININVRSALQLTQAVLPGMKERGWGRIINISSLTVLGFPERTCYAAAKSALMSFTRSWGLELATTGITANAVAPGSIETELFRKFNPPGSAGEAQYRSAIPMKRLGKPDEIAAAIFFLLSDDAAFITGQTLFVDGGESIGHLSV